MSNTLEYIEACVCGYIFLNEDDKQAHIETHMRSYISDYEHFFELLCCDD